MSGPSKAERARPTFFRFFDRVLIGDGCWGWQGMRRPTGHGRVMLDGRRVSAARVAYELWYGPAAEDLFALHHCDNPPCVRPDHIYMGTQPENVADRDRRGRHANAKKTVCPKCHGEYTVLNGKRHCIPCQRAYGREYARRKRSAQ